MATTAASAVGRSAERRIAATLADIDQRWRSVPLATRQTDRALIKARVTDLANLASRGDVQPVRRLVTRRLAGAYQRLALVEGTRRTHDVAELTDRVCGLFVRANPDKGFQVLQTRVLRRLYPSTEMFSQAVLAVNAAPLSELRHDFLWPPVYTSLWPKTSAFYRLPPSESMVDLPHRLKATEGRMAALYDIMAFRMLVGKSDACPEIPDPRRLPSFEVRPILQLLGASRGVRPESLLEFSEAHLGPRARRWNSLDPLLQAFARQRKGPQAFELMKERHHAAVLSASGAARAGSGGQSEQPEQPEQEHESEPEQEQAQQQRGPLRPRAAKLSESLRMYDRYKLAVHALTGRWNTRTAKARTSTTSMLVELDAMARNDPRIAPDSEMPTDLSIAFARAYSEAVPQGSTLLRSTVLRLLHSTPNKPLDLANLLTISRAMQRVPRTDVLDIFGPWVRHAASPEVYEAPKATLAILQIYSAAACRSPQTQPDALHFEFADELFERAQAKLRATDGAQQSFDPFRVEQQSRLQACCNCMVRIYYGTGQLEKARDFVENVVPAASCAVSADMCGAELFYWACRQRDRQRVIETLASMQALGHYPDSHSLSAAITGMMDGNLDLQGLPKQKLEELLPEAVAMVVGFCARDRRLKPRFWDIERLYKACLAAGLDVPRIELGKIGARFGYSDQLNELEQKGFNQTS